MTTKVFLSAIAALAILPASGQVSVQKTGKLVLGATNTSTAIAENGKQAATDASMFDPQARLVVLGAGTNVNGGRISFGLKDNVSVGELYTGIDTDILHLRGDGGLRYTQKGDDIFSYTGRDDRIFAFSTGVESTGFYMDSDAHASCDIRDINDEIQGLAFLRPVRFLNKSDGCTRDRFGLLAQDVSKIYPELVSVNHQGHLTVDYVSLIPILIRAVNELEETVYHQNLIIGELQDHKRAQLPGASSVSKTEDCQLLLYQNRPNPFAESTVISCSVPSQISEANIYVYDLQGQQKLRIPIMERGNVNVTIDAGTLSAGMYLYSLVADNSEVSTKRMIITDK